MTPLPLTIHLFGPLQVRVGSQPLPRPRTRSVEWLLALLVLRHGRAVPRAWLAGTLWPESEESQALQNLRQDLVSLRKALGPEAGRLIAPARGALALDCTGAEVDVVRFDGAIRAGDEEALRAAVDLYTGPLLEGCVEEWAIAERESRAEQCLTALERLAEWAEGRGDLPAAIHALRRAAALDPLRDSPHQRLMTHLAATGDPAAAVAVYRDFRSHLHEAINAPPDAATTQLFHEIRAAARERMREGARERERNEPGRHPVAPSLPRSLPPSLPPSLSPSLPALHRPPCPLTPLIGREQEVGEVAEQLRQRRLVTLIGGGGVGKTRLALELAATAGEAFPAGAVWVELVPLGDGAHVLPALATALGLREIGSDEPEALYSRLIARLADDAPLLILDNCEHVLDAAAAVVQRLLDHCPTLHVLATSRQRLGLTGEAAWRVPSLPVPEAVRLFVERAAEARAGFRLASPEDAAAVGRICHRLDGIPLAIELAAARARVLTPHQIVERLDDRLNLLTTGARTALPRHQTLRALIDWSYDTLMGAEATLLRRLSVFVDGWTLEAAEAVCSDGVGSWQLAVGSPTIRSVPLPTANCQLPTAEVLDLLDSLADKSLVLVEERAGELRYRMLETIREYAGERLRESGDEEAARHRHLTHFLELAQESSPALRGPAPAAALQQVEAEIGNFRAALPWAQTEAAPPGAYLGLVAALWPFWELTGALSEGRAHLQAALAAGGGREAPERAQVLLGAATLAFLQYDRDEALARGQEALEAFRALGDRQGSAAALLCMGQAAREKGDPQSAQALFTAALEDSRWCGWTGGSALALGQLGFLARSGNDKTRARSLLEEGVTLAETAGDALLLAQLLRHLGYVALTAGDHHDAGAVLEQSLAIHRQVGHKHGMGLVLRHLGTLARQERDFARARSYLEEAVGLSREMGNRAHLAFNLQEYGFVLCEQRAYAPADAALSQSVALFLQLGYGRQARWLHREALAIFQRQGHVAGMAASLEGLGILEARDGEAAKAAWLLGAASRIEEGLSMPLTRGGPEARDQAVAALREKLGLEAWEAAWQEGRAMPLEQAITDALGSEH